MKPLVRCRRKPLKSDRKKLRRVTKSRFVENLLKKHNQRKVVNPHKAAYEKRRGIPSCDLWHDKTLYHSMPDGRLKDMHRRAVWLNVDFRIG